MASSFDYTAARLTLSLTCLVSVIYLVLRLIESLLLKPGPREPPLVRSSLPFIGHIVGLLRNGVSYYPYLRSLSELPILTIYLASQKTYIVNSPELISLISRRSKEIDGTIPFISIVYGKLFGLSQPDIDELLNRPCEDGSLRQGLHQMEQRLLSPSAPEANQLYVDIFNCLAGHVNSIGQGKKTFCLLQWIQESFVLSTANALHGQTGPFAMSPDLAKTFWDFEKGLKGLTMGIFTNVTAAKPAAARQRIVDALMEYFGDSFPTESASELVRVGRKLAQEHNMSTDFMARYGLGLVTGFVINTVPASFWNILRISTDEYLLSKVRQELSAFITPSIQSPGSVTLDVKAVRKSCPLFMSVCQETLRTISSSTGTFLVQEDVTIGDQYQLKKGAILQMAATAIHSDPNVWGPDANDFDPERFLKPNKVHPAADRTFGGGATLCPGRNLALDEIVTFTAMFITTFDVSWPPGTAGFPEQDDKNMLSVKKPKSDNPVVIQRRRGSEGLSWAFGGT